MRCRLLLEACLFGLTIFTLRRQKSTSEFPRVSRLVRSLYRHAIIFFLVNRILSISPALHLFTNPFSGEHIQQYCKCRYMVSKNNLFGVSYTLDIA